MIPLPPSQQRVLDAVLAFEKGAGYMPTISELSSQLGIQRSAIHRHLAALQQAGAIRTTAYQARSIRITGREDRWDRALRLLRDWVQQPSEELRQETSLFLSST